MGTSDQTAYPAPPNIITAFRGGFDAIANRVYLILIPIALDLWLWLGPHLQIKSLMADILATINASPGIESGASGSLILLDPAAVEAAVERINLMTILRSYPVGIPSLVSGILPLEVPFGQAHFMDISSPTLAVSLWIALFLLGTLAGTYYFMLIAQATLNGQVMLKRALYEWAHVSIQMIALTLIAVILVLVLLIPAFCILSFMMMAGIPVSQIGLIIIAGMLLWVLFPLTFTPLGIVAFRLNLLVAIQRSLVLTRMTLPNTALFIIMLFITSQGLDILWRVPQEDSWFTLVGLAGHAFVASGLLAASFVYYRDANAWVQKIGLEMRRTESVS